MARRISGVGRVTVSLRRSTKPDPPAGAVAGAMTSMLATLAARTSAWTAPGSPEGAESVGGIGQFGVHRGDAGEQVPGPGHVPGPLVQVAQHVPLPEMT